MCGNSITVCELIADKGLEALTKIANKARKSEKASNAPDQPLISKYERLLEMMIMPRDVSLTDLEVRIKYYATCQM
jgi:hypothetical protein